MLETSYSCLQSWAKQNNSLISPNNLAFEDEKMWGFSLFKNCSVV